MQNRHRNKLSEAAINRLKLISNTELFRGGRPNHRNTLVNMYAGGANSENRSEEQSEALTYCSGRGPPPKDANAVLNKETRLHIRVPLSYHAYLLALTI